MKDLQWQCNWPKRFWSWPWWHQTVDTEFKIVTHWFGIGPLQFCYWKGYN